ncbi:MAG: ferredoxin [Candidatus Hodarchaeota archaeon]
MRDTVHKAKYRVIVNRDQCIDCGIATGQCPTHAKMLARLLNTNQVGLSGGVFSEDVYDRVKQLVDACPVNAIKIEKMDKLGKRFMIHNK